MSKETKHLTFDDIYKVITTWENEWELMNYFGYVKFIEVKKTFTFASVEEMIRITENLKTKFGNAFIYAIDTIEMTCSFALKIEHDNVAMYDQFRKVLVNEIA